eukprot:Gregarina_sp_Pseudo_9__5555@NODE_73_length_4587_cov_88_906113_g67_i0_p1_GENE_NODE_73_length_4587_cov_88_906113_g67_i0NODE_73_length_4587_cov_88_906113_g67_i0_p1_ORF_typecomplete_len602_score192_35MFS_2/PF13347_6/3e10MFS_2/PF13347_6/5_4e07MFS_1/PF07690_16/4_2e02MFS_1/PF07690_16/0_0014MFS_1/PF07690_16/3_7e09_NODE_73_length_4587_cov_88_906113_g67_i017533558
MTKATSGQGGSSLEILIGSPVRAAKTVKFANPTILEPVRSNDYAAAAEDEGAAAKRRPETETAAEPSTFPPGYFVSRMELVKLSIFNFPYGLICGTMALCILPAEASRLAPMFQSYALGFFLGVVGLSQLVCPLVGKISDKYEARSPFGQRMPFFFLGSWTASAATLLMWLSSANLSFFGFSLALLLGMCGLNICSSIQTGLVPSFVDAKRSGEASGVSAVGTLLGASVGFGIMAICNQWDFHFVYPLYSGLLTVALATTVSACATLDARLCASTAATDLETASPPLVLPRVISAEDADQSAEMVQAGFCSSASFVGESLTSLSSSNGSDLGIAARPPTAAGDPGSGGGSAFSLIRFDDVFVSQSKLLKSVEAQSLLSSYYLPLNDQTRDFFWVFVGRTCYYVAVSVQAFILYYLRDVVNTADEATRMTQVGVMALTAQSCAALVAYPLGRSIDSMGVSRKLLIYLACFIMSLCYVMLAASPVFGAHAFYFVWFAAIVYGVGNGCFLAVDYSIALTTLPDKSQAAQSLGLWGLSAFVGSALGPLLWGFAVQVMGSAFHPAHAAGEAGEVSYSYWGYLCMLLGGVAATACSALCIATLRSVR